MDKETMIFDKICEFMNKYNVDCVEYTFQKDFVNKNYADLASKLVEIMLEE